MLSHMEETSLVGLSDTDAYVVLSLDVELAWGVLNVDQGLLSFLKMNEDYSRSPTVFLLRAFRKYSIPCTWAVVGHLFLSHCERDNGTPHRDIPRFSEDWYSLDPCSDLDRDPLFYGKDIVEMIMSDSIEHEIGYHSFSHVIFSRCSRDVARAELRMGKELAEDLGIDLRSFVFPQNEVGHVDLLREFGFRIYRGAGIWKWKDYQRFFSSKINAIADRLLTSPTVPIRREGIWEVPTCLHFWNVESPLGSLWQAKMGIRRAVKEKSIFTIYFHPWDLLWNPLLKNKVEVLLKFVSRARDEGKISVVTMGGLSEILDTQEIAR